MPARSLAFSFDLDGTLLDPGGTEAALLEACQELAYALPGLDARQLLDANREIWPPYWQEVEGRWILGGLTGAEVSLEAWRRTLELCGCRDESVVERARDAHARHQRTALRLFDDVEGTLTALRGRYRLALVTNGAADTQRAALEVTGVAHYFDAVVLSSEVGVAKPDPVIYERSAAELGVECGQMWHVGDNLHTDVAGAIAAGMTAVWLNRVGVSRRQTDPRPGYEIGSLLELQGLLG